MQVAPVSSLPGVSQMIKGLWWLIAVGVLVASMLTALPLFFSLFGVPKPDKWSEWGAWLQGVLTPLSLLVAAVALWQQKQSQSEANTVASRTFFAGNVQLFTELIGRQCKSCLTRVKQNAKWDDAKDESRALDYMKSLLSEGAVGFDLGEKNWLQHVDFVVSTSDYHILCKTVNEIVSQADSVGLRYMLDDRIQSIHSLIASRSKRSLDGV